MAWLVEKQNFPCVNERWYAKHEHNPLSAWRLAVICSSTILHFRGQLFWGWWKRNLSLACRAVNDGRARSLICSGGLFPESSTHSSSFAWERRHLDRCKPPQHTVASVHFSSRSAHFLTQPRATYPLMRFSGMIPLIFVKGFAPVVLFLCGF